MSTADWYARKMQQSTQTAVPSTPLPPTPVGGAASPPRVQHSPPMAAPVVAPQETGCPKCHSGNYGKSMSNAAPRCFDCGYVEGRDYWQETYSGTRVDNTQATKQIPVQQYAPQQIIGRVE